MRFEVIGTDPAKLRGFYGTLFEWDVDTGGSVARSVSDPGDYAFTGAGAVNEGGGGIPGGVGGGPSHDRQVIFYKGVPDVEAALRKAARLGGQRRMGPERAPGRELVVAHFADPEGNLIGLAGPA
nr:VOC family protein [Micromonospora sp. DSM 115978]